MAGGSRSSRLAALFSALSSSPPRHSNEDPQKVRKGMTTAGLKKQATGASMRMGPSHRLPRSGARAGLVLGMPNTSLQAARPSSAEGRVSDEQRAARCGAQQKGSSAAAASVLLGTFVDRCAWYLHGSSPIFKAES
eukprot:CAMPEP_0117663226 /NCGR_PEP_ID=MMETSP0804-20121206/8490_1 /TAXON_ID=1074897 /ORGANISM="Tetraselmis astigmatica, Strain CCMP880" /LENGTH=135 /DNA_ID=CAMNT_0005470211 /DNA_START=23 /DNA_END=430 /DNA_ORIENTATION=-